MFEMSMKENKIMLDILTCGFLSRTGQRMVLDGLFDI